MSDYLVFPLYGPMAAWGDIAVGEVRPSFAHPSKSAVIGMLAAAMGIRRDEDDRFRRLAENSLFAVRVDAMGTPLCDYHTVQMPPQKRGVIHYTRRSELAGDDLNALISTRDYRCDAVYLIAIQVQNGSEFTGGELARALEKPAFTLYLGRKSCPPALPLKPVVFNGETLRDVLALAHVEYGDLAGIISKSHALLYWEEGMESGFSGDQVTTRRDGPISSTRRQFRVRREYFCSIPREAAT